MPPGFAVPAAATNNMDLASVGGGISPAPRVVVGALALESVDQGDARAALFAYAAVTFDKKGESSRAGFGGFDFVVAARYSVGDVFFWVAHGST